ncbi:MAG: Lin0512 family protein [Gammaproteobacteria bacterium]|nr:Lin0512 family protein [Gammaproteobacteria bacterium]
MARKRMVVEMGMGTDLQGQDYTKAAVRALRDALWHNSLTVAPAFGIPRENMLVEVTIGVAQPSQVDRDAVAGVLPYGSSTIEVVEGGLDIPSEDGSKVTVVANAAAVVFLDLEREPSA